MGRQVDPGVPVVDDLDEHVQGSDPTVVVFYADWCGYSRAFLPSFKERVQTLDIDAVAANISSRSDPRWATYDVDTVPTLIAFREGEPVARVDGRAGRGLKAQDVDKVLAEASP